MSNTIIQVKRSSNTVQAPNGSLAAGQPGYSFVSDKLFIGNSAGSGVLTIGGQYFVDVVAGATSANSANNLVKRDANGDIFVRQITADTFNGTIATAAALTPGRYIASGGEVSGNVAFDGSQNINLALTLNNTGVAAGQYGASDGSLIPYFIIDARGRISFAANATATGGSTFNVKGNTGTDVITSGDNLNFYGGDGLSAAVTANTGNTIVAFAVDSTVVRTTGDQSVGGIKTFTGDMVLSGNLTVSGVTTYVNSTQLQIGDNLVVLNADLPIGSAPTEDAGIEVNRGNVNGNASIYFDETNDWWTAVANNILSGASALGRIHTDSYANATALSTGTVPSARVAGSYTGITGLGTITVGTWQGTNIAVGFGGTGRASFTLNGVLYGNATGDLIATAAPTEGQILQGSAAGVPSWGSIDGGSF